MVILLNAGATYHIGSSRMYVSLARRWAQRGYYVLRMDLSGLGESRARVGCAENNVFPPDAIEDISAAVEFMQRRYGAREITVSGLCSGAYHSLRAAVAGLPLNRLLMVNAQNYFWDQSMTLEGLQLAEVVRNPTIYRARIFSARAWKRFLTGQVNIWRIVRIYLQRPVLAVKSRLRDMARAAGIRLRNDLGRELETIIARGVRVVFVFARGEPGADLLRIEAGSMVRRLGERCRVRIIDSADHTFSRSGPRQVLEEVLSEELFARQDSAAQEIATERRARELGDKSQHPIDFDLPVVLRAGFLASAPAHCLPHLRGACKKDHGVRKALYQLFATDGRYQEAARIVEIVRRATPGGRNDGLAGAHGLEHDSPSALEKAREHQAVRECELRRRLHLRQPSCERHASGAFSRGKRKSQLAGKCLQPLPFHAVPRDHRRIVACLAAR